MTFYGNMLQPIHSMVQRYGVKAVVYGGPGTGKTPLMLTAPNAAHAFAEPGLLSIRASNQFATMIDTGPKINDFVHWACYSTEARYFETICLDSISQMAEIFLREAENPVGSKKRNPDPRSWFGDMSKAMMHVLDSIYYAPNLNCVMLAKQGSVEVEGITKYRPYFPGQDLNIKVPHLFDSVWRLESTNVNGVQSRYIRTRENHSSFARERSGNLAELEHADLAYLINKSKQ